MPLEHPAIRESVPVGAIVVVVAFLTRDMPGASKIEPGKLGNTPRSRASCSEHSLALPPKNFMNFSARLKERLLL
jgi:hypothetical protein